MAIHFEETAHPWVISDQLILLRRAVEELECQLDAERRRADALEAQARERVTLYAEAEHKLKTELAVVCGWARTLDERWDVLDAADVRHGIEVIRMRAEDMNERAMRLLEEARSEIGVTAATDFARLDLAEVLEATVRSAAGMSHKHPIELKAHGNAFVEVDPGALQQVIGHLLENAVKYSPEGGLIHVRVRRSGRWVEVAIADDGVGIPEDVDLFAPFQRGTHDGISGTGLGLYIVAKLVQGMGGRIEARRNRKNGSTFVLQLPAA